MSSNNYNILSENDESTVASKYEKDIKADEGYQSEAELEAELIKQLQAQGIEYVDIKCTEDLISNLRLQLEKLNNYKFSDHEWDSFFKMYISTENSNVVDKTFTIQKDYIKTITCDDNKDRNIYLINKENIHANSTQVINQYVPTGGKQSNRYDVTILVNGLPLVHIELKRRGVSIKEAFNQINRYERESFWAGSGLYNFVQVFIISNGTLTKYYSNTTRVELLKEKVNKSSNNKVKTSNSYEFTNYWAGEDNKIIPELTKFTHQFLNRHTLLEMLTKYCVFTEQQLLLVMRPYQKYATEKLIEQIKISHLNKKYGTRDAGGYIWHTTGSGKTLTSFKAAQIATELEYIHKVLFVVDRKDLDYQTMKEYDKFEKGCANGNTSTKILAKQIDDPKCRIIITTIQKLSSYVRSRENSAIYDQEVVIIFDECHRSQFGQMHADIIKRFKKYYIFGFTGTPIFEENKTSVTNTMIRGNNPWRALIKTTDDVFGKRLHTYTIVDAIRDENVLPFRLAYIRTIKEKEDIENSKVWDIERDKALMAQERISKVATHIINNFDTQTRRKHSYFVSRLSNIKDVVEAKNHKVKEITRLSKQKGFNSIFAVQSIESAKLYYREFKNQMSLLPKDNQLKIATIYSYKANEEVDFLMDEEDCESIEGLDQSSKEFLGHAIEDYNKMFGTSYDTSSEKYQNYYKDVSLRMKNREIDLLIVVNMFLTGFDATTLNTLWVDKNLRYHGLIQAFSRTNRILNSIKKTGNIVCFRNLEEATNKALALFGDSEAHSTTLLRPFEDYINGYDENGVHVKGYNEYVRELIENYSLYEIMGNKQLEKDFIRLFGIILRLHNLLSNFEQFEDNNILSERKMQDYTSIYLDLSEKYRNQEKLDKEDIIDDIEFEIEVVKEFEVDIDYILELVRLYRLKRCEDDDIKQRIYASIDSSPTLRNKKELIHTFVESINPKSNVHEEWKIYVNSQKISEFNIIIEEEKLNKEEAIKFIEKSFERGYVPDGGLEIDEILPPIDPYDKEANRMGIRQRILDRINAFFEKYYDIANGQFSD